MSSANKVALPGDPALPGEHGADEHGVYARDPGCVSGQPVSDPARHRPDPLAVARSRQDPIDQVRGGVCHPPGSARRTDAPALAREGDHHLGRAAVAADPGEAAAEDAAAEVVLELALDEARQAESVGGLGACLG
jgi:hypothetical protein